MSLARADAVVIGGGFFGTSVACHLKKKFPAVVLLEQEPELFRHASWFNQARIHNGYHYPRSLQTAYRSRVNFDLFVRDFPECVVRDFTALYCIARENSKITPRQFERFCNVIGAPWQPAAAHHTALFDPRLIGAVYQVVEYAFNATTLRDLMAAKLTAAGVGVRLNSHVESVEGQASRSRVLVQGGEEIETDYVFNCAYSGIAHKSGRHEIAEIALIEPPPELSNLAVTVMCGSFFSTMPFPPRGLHSLSHVRYTPHCSWEDSEETSNAYQMLNAHPKSSNAPRMLLDARRYMPSIARARVVDSMFEVKTVLKRNQLDDGRPLLMERRDSPNAVYNIMGGKIDNIYDVLHALRAEGL